MIKQAVVTSDTPSVESGKKNTIDVDGESLTVKEASAKKDKRSLVALKTLSDIVKETNTKI